jgi:hypothetical protein
MSDLYDQSRILYHLYFLSLTGTKTALWMLVAYGDFNYMHGVGTLLPALYRLRKTGYVKGDDMNLELTGEGIKAIELLFFKFLKYMEKSKPNELRTWINTLKLDRHSSQKLIRNSYHYIINVPDVREAFNNYLNELGSLET